MLWGLVWRFLSPYRRLAGAVIALQTISTMATLCLPTINAAIIDDGVVKGDTPTVVRLGAIMFAVGGLQIVCAVGAVYVGSGVSMGLSRDLRMAIFHHVTGFSAEETARFGPSSLLTRTTNDVWHLEVLVEMTFTVLVTAPIMGVGGIVMAAQQDVGLSWLLLVSVPVLAAANYWIVSHLLPVYRHMQELLDDVNRVMREQLSGIKVIRAFTRETLERNRFGEASSNISHAALAAGRWQALLQPAATLVINVSSVALIWFGGLRIADGQMHFGDLIAYLTYFMQILLALTLATTFVAMLPQATVCAERITGVLSTNPRLVSPGEPVRPGNIEGVVRLNAATYRYPTADRPVLAEITLTARPGTTTAIVGGTGSGKSTLISLICRLADVTAGTVYIDGVDVRQYDIDSLWASVGLVPQRGYLFSGTVTDNLRYGKADATEEEMWEALRVASADDFVHRAGGLDTPVAQGGVNFSGGQRQRLSIARAVVRRPSIYLFDDAFSALDVHTDSRVRAALREVSAKSTVIMVSQRISTVMEADHVVVIDAGRIVGTGTHQSLIDDCPVYAEFVDSQAVGMHER